MRATRAASNRPAASRSTPPRPGPAAAARRADRPLFGRLGLTPNGLTLIGFGITIVAAVLAGAPALAGRRHRRLRRRRLRHVRRRPRPGDRARSASSARSWTRVFDRWGEAVVYVGIVVGCVDAGFDLGAVPGGRRHGLGLHGQLRPGEVRGPRLHPGHGMAAVGLAPREVRLVILRVGLVLAGPRRRRRDRTLRRRLRSARARPRPRSRSWPPSPSSSASSTSVIRQSSRREVDSSQ